MVVKRGTRSIKRPHVKRNTTRKVVISILLAITGIIIAVVAYQYTYSAKLEVELNSKQTELKTKAQVIEQKAKELNLSESQKLELQKQIDDLNKQKEDLNNQLQSKAAEKARIASIQPAQAAPTPKTVSYPNTGDAKAFIYQKESGNNPAAVNKSSGACGLGQALPCSKMGCSLQDYACQDAFFTNYMLARYGSWEAAKAFWTSHNWW